MRMPPIEMNAPPRSTAGEGALEGDGGDALRDPEEEHDVQSQQAAEVPERSVDHIPVREEHSRFGSEQDCARSRRGHVESSAYHGVAADPERRSEQ
jgi:hypothetical protein